MKKTMIAVTLASLSMGHIPTVKAQQLEEVVVTATKRAESLQDVPVSVISTSGKQINEMSLTNAADVTSFLPAITIAENPVGNFVFIRGVGTAGINQGIEQSVSIFHDNLYLGRHQLSRAPFMDLERVEVLRGPQSILFGKNTIGGAIHAIAAKPTNQNEGRVSVLFGTDGELEANTVISGPITEKVRGRVSARVFQLDGYIDNVITGEDGPERDDWTVRGQLEIDASENLKINAKWEASEFNTGQQTTQIVVVNPFDPVSSATSALNQVLVATATGTSGELNFDDERAIDNDGGALLGQILPSFAGLPGFPDLDELSENNVNQGSIAFEWDLNGHTLTAISGYAEYDYIDVCDCDFAAVPLIQVDASEDYSQFSQEIRLASPGGEKIDYIIGAYYQQSDLEYRATDSFGTTIAHESLGVPTPLLVPNLARSYGLNQDQDQWAVFGSATFNFTDKTRLTTGLRYFEETKTADHFLNTHFAGGWDFSALLGLPAGSVAFDNTVAGYDSFLAGFGSADLGGGLTAGFLTEAIFTGLLGTFEHDIQNRERDEDAVTWSINLQHDFTTEVLGYASVSSGFKSGGFDARFLRTNDDPNFEFEEEEAISYELGIKSTLLDGAMRFNATAFFSEIDDYQVSIFDGATAFLVQNAAQVESKGVEVEVDWALNNQFTLRASGTWLDATYSDFPNAPCFASSASDVRGNCVNFGTPNSFRDATGETNLFSPEFAFNVNLDYLKAINNSLMFRASMNVNYSDEYFVASDLDPIFGRQDSFTRLDARLALMSADGKWEMAIIGKNLTDEFISGTNNDVPLTSGNGFAQLSRLRSVSAQISYNW